MHFKLREGKLSYVKEIQTILSQPSPSQPSKFLIWKVYI